MSADEHRLARIIFSGMNDIEEWRLGDPALAAAKGYPRDYPADVVDDFGIIFADLAVDAATGSLVCHEVNGPNAVGSDALTGNSLIRAENEARQAARRAKEFGLLLPDGRLKTPVATIHAHQHWRFFRTGGEFYPRVAQFADILGGRLPGNQVACHAASDALSDDAAIAVVMGDVPAIAAGIEIDPQSGRLNYQGRPVIFMGNPNLLPELARVGKLRSAGDVNFRVLHGWRLASALQDKGLQQDLFASTAVRPLRHFSAGSREEAARNTRDVLAHGPVVLKPSNTSGGAGVLVVVPGMTDAEIDACIEELLTQCRAKYGDNVEAMLFPLRGFEFVRSTGYAMGDGDHLWDIRIAILFEPGRAKAFPVSLRFAPHPFDPDGFHKDRDQWVSNVSGRQQTLLRSGMDDAVLAAVGMDDALMQAAMQSCVSWTMKAWDRSVRDGGKTGSVFEDAREEADKPFYRWEKFVT